ncbi:MAG: ATP-dependent helicase [Bacillota bacterium]
MLTFAEFRDSVRAAVPDFATYWLNGRQEAAVEAAPSPPVFIVAGPGTGKTTVLALRALKLILVDGFAPELVIATTFTRKAAAELRSRILSWGYATIQEVARQARQAGDHTHLAWLENLDINAVRTGTLDSIAEEMLGDDRRPGEITPAVVEGFMARGLLRRNVIYVGRRDQSEELTEHLCSFNPVFPGARRFAEKLGVCQGFAQRVMHDGIDLGAYAAGGVGHGMLVEIVRDYHGYLRDQHLVDFALLEADVLERLRAGRLTEGLGALLVDEFQDTNFLQEQIYYELCRRSGAALTVVGDDDQSVYRFRGATVEIFADFTDRIVEYLGPEWKPARYDLVENYRSSPRIVGLFNHFITVDRDYLASRVPDKQPCAAAAAWAQDPQRNIPVLGLFRPDVESLAEDLCGFLMDVFRGDGYRVQVAGGQTYTIQRALGGDFGDAVYLAWKVREYGSNKKERLPLLIRRRLRAEGVSVFNPRGRSLAAIPDVEVCLGVMLECIDPGARIQNSIRSIRRETAGVMRQWRESARLFVADDPPPGGLEQFVADWAARNPRHMQKWPAEWPLLELLFTVITWLPRFQEDPEGQVYLEAVARTIAQAAQIGIYSSSILHGTAYDQSSVREAIREVFEAIAEENADVNEDIMPYVPRSYFPLMTVHQAKGLEFPLVVVDVGSDFRKNLHAQARFRYPRDGDNTHFTEDHVADFTPVGPARLARSRQQRAFDDIRRLYYVAKSRAENVLVLTGLTSQLQLRNPVLSVATGDCVDGERRYRFVPAEHWSPDAPDDCIALI